MLTDGGIATDTKFITDILTGPSYAQVGISCLQRIPQAAAYPTVPWPPPTTFTLNV